MIDELRDQRYTTRGDLRKAKPAQCFRCKRWIAPANTEQHDDACLRAAIEKARRDPVHNVRAP